WQPRVLPFGACSFQSLSPMSKNCSCVLVGRWLFQTWRRVFRKNRQTAQNAVLAIMESIEKSEFNTRIGVYPAILIFFLHYFHISQINISVIYNVLMYIFWYRRPEFQRFRKQSGRRRHSQ